MSTTLPPIDSSLLPADVRNGSKTDQDNYKSALQFERQLVEQLTQTMSDTTKAMKGAPDSDDGSSDGSDAVTDSYNQQLPGIMADAIMQNGGLGLARTIAQNLKGSQS
jgi:Rod binding domain-containing protein